MTLIFNALSPLKVMDWECTSEKRAIRTACPQITQKHGVTLQHFFFFILKVAQGQWAANGDGMKKFLPSMRPK